VTPVLKWPGGKRQLAGEILSRLPTTYNRYFEPFAGSAAVFFKLLPPRAILSDLNESLINCYRAIKNDPGSVIAALRRLKNTEDDYYSVRDDWEPRERHTRAARFLYLQRLSFNGLYRENHLGQFNVPYGYKTHLKPCEANVIWEASRALKSAKIIRADYASVLLEAKRGDLIYIDPPYTVAHNNNGFIKYNAKLFSWADQVALAAECRRLYDIGCHIVVSNADHDSVYDLYKKHFRIIQLHRHSVIAADAANRKPTAEILVVSKH
jgi:DNA adenine methylase